MITLPVDEASKKKYDAYFVKVSSLDDMGRLEYAYGSPPVPMYCVKSGGRYSIRMPAERLWDFSLVYCLDVDKPKRFCWYTPKDDHEKEACELRDRITDPQNFKSLNVPIAEVESELFNGLTATNGEFKTVMVKSVEDLLLMMFLSIRFTGEALPKVYVFPYKGADYMANFFFKDRLMYSKMTEKGRFNFISYDYREQRIGYHDSITDAQAQLAAIHLAEPFPFLGENRK